MGENSLKQRIQDDMKAALKNKEADKLSAIRLIVAAIKQREIDERITLDDNKVISILEKMLKQRRDSISQYEKANRQDLADKEKYEVSIIQEYMPEPLSEEEINSLIKSIISETGASSIAHMGKVINEIKSKVQGRADMAIVSAKIKSLLSDQE